MSILVVGSVAYDTVETPFGRAEQVLGGSASFFSVAASFFAPVNLVAVVGEVAEARTAELGQAGRSELVQSALHDRGIPGGKDRAGERPRKKAIRWRAVPIERI